MKRLRAPLLMLVFVCLEGCVVVPRYARETLGDPAMAANEDMFGRSLRKLRTTREGAAGGDGTTAGGGCGCGQ